MTRWEIWLQHVANLLVGGTGLGYAWFRYFQKPLDEFSQASHPLQIVFQDLHVLTAPLLVFACALIWRSHVLQQLEQKNSGKRVSGWTLIVAMAPMIVSGYFIQVAAQDIWRDTWVAIHLVASAVWLAGMVFHLIPAFRKVRRRRHS